MTNRTPTHLLTADLVAALTDDEITGRLSAYEAFQDPEELETPAGITLLYAERDRRAADETFSRACPTCGQTDARPAAQWFLVTAGAVTVLAKARAGAEIEDALRMLGLDGNSPIAWQPLDNLTEGQHGNVYVIPKEDR